MTPKNGSRWSKLELANERPVEMRVADVFRKTGVAVEAKRASDPDRVGGP